MFVTLDGFISGPKGELDWMPGTEDHLDDEVDSYLYNLLDEMDTMLLGGRTYELFVAYWPTKTFEEQIVADKLNAMTKVVFSSVPEVNWGTWETRGWREAPSRRRLLDSDSSPARTWSCSAGPLWRSRSSMHA